MYVSTGPPLVTILDGAVSSEQGGHRTDAFRTATAATVRPQAERLQGVRTHVRETAHVEEEERIAHSGGFARWPRFCANHPWRVVSTWIGIFVVLIGLNAAFHGKLINDFKIPGSDTQKATDLINAKFGGSEGRRAARRAGCARRRAARHAAADGGDRRRCSPQATAVAALARRPDQKDVSQIANPLAAGSTSCPRTAGSRSSTCSTTRPASSCRARRSSASRTSCARSASRPGSRSSSPARPRTRRRRRASATSSACSPPSSS